MARILANRVVLHGNREIKKLENEIFKRFYKDYKKNGGYRDSDVIKRILFGLTQNDEFNWEEKIGTDWAYFQKQDGKESIVFIAPFPSVSTLQDHITLHTSKIDPNVVVQLEYEDISGAVIGTRLSTYSDSKGIAAFQTHKFTPSADNRELSRTAMKKIRDSQRKEVMKSMTKELGDDYGRINLAI